MTLRAFYLTMAAAGAIIPWIFFVGFVGANGVDLGAFIASLFANPAAGGFTADLLLSSVVFWIWSYTDAAKHGVRHWWIVLPANLLVGLSLAMPLYFVLRLSKGAGARNGRPIN